MLKLTTGSFRCIEEAFLADLWDARSADPLTSLLVLSPSGRLLTHLQRRLTGSSGRADERGSEGKDVSHAQSTAFLNVHFLTFYALAERLLAEAEYTELVVAEPELYHALIRKILTGSAPEKVDRAIRDALHLDGKPIPRGLPGALAATLRDLRDAGMRADYALQAAHEGFLGPEAPEAAAMLALYGRLTGLLETFHLRTPADLLRRAALRAPAHPWLSRQKAIFLYGFYDLTGVQLDLALALAEHPNAHVYFPCEEGNPAYAYAEKMLKDPAFVTKCKVTPSLRGRPPLGSSGGAPRNDGKIEIWSCSGCRDEVWLAAKEILRLVDEGVPFDQIAVISRNPTPYLPALREIFGAHQIPYGASRGEPAGSHPLVKTVRALLTLDERNPRTKISIKDLQKSPYFDERQIAASPPRRGRAPRNDGQIDVASWSVHIVWARERIDQFIRLPSDASDEEKALLEAVSDTLETLNILDILGEPVSLEHFLETWQSKLDSLERPGPAQAHAGVQVLEVQQARGLAFRAVFLLGMNEKVFPRLIREDPFLSDAARSALAQATGCRLGRKLDGYAEERLLFELMRQAATERLYLFTERSDEEGKALIPSLYLRELERLIPGLTPERLPRSLAEKFEKRIPLSWTPKELSLLMNRAALDPKNLYTALGWDAAEFQRLAVTHRAMETFKPGIGPYDGMIEDLEPIQLLLKRGFSPSSLEDLAECPFQYYASHVLRIAPEEDLAPEGELTPQALGKLFHKTLELFYTACRDRGLPTGEAELASQLVQAAEASFKEFTEGLSGIYPLAIKATKIFVNSYLLKFLESDTEDCRSTGFRPAWFEQSMEGLIPLLHTRYPFHGKPDRLDIRREEGTAQVRVVDYKSGKPKPWSGRIETHIIQGKFLQLPIYLGLAGSFAEKILGIKVQAAEARLRPLRESGEESTEKTLGSGFWESPSAAIFGENIRELIGIIEKGRFYIEPSSGEWGYCERCDFARICRKEHMPTRRRAERDSLRIRVKEKLGRTAPKV